MEKHIKNKSITYFDKVEEININYSLNKIVYLKVKSPLKYGIKSLEYYGRVTKVTKCYFEIIEYCDGSLNYWYTNEINKKEQTMLTKKWAKKSIELLYEIKTSEENKALEIYNN